MAVWPVFLWRNMHEDMGHLFSIGAVVSWDVMLVDGAAEGWPCDGLVDTEVVIDERPAFALHGSLARTPQLSACWRGKDPVGSRLEIRAGLSVDLFNPPFLSTVTGVVQRIQIATSRMVRDERRVWNASGTWQLADVRESPRWLAPIGPDPGTRQEVGFLVALDVRSDEIRPFPERPTDATSRRVLARPTLPQ
ncbi:MAG: hypothetical protein ACXVII_45935 [Solirubrobacteraceae bacterium]